jgi:AcrR family transcriptional regulator
MARPKSEDKRTAIMAAATRVIVSQGLGAPTAKIAKEAGISNGSLFTYFKTKAELYNQLYLELKTTMATATLQDFPAKAELREQAFHAWTNWINWSLRNREKRRALSLLYVSDEITPETRAAAAKSMAGAAVLLEHCRAHGSMKKAPLAFVTSIMNAMVETTIDIMLHDPANAKEHNKTGFEALWRVID